ncbi:hypothetical protein [Saccharopolyspora dendranthemae]|uniref:Lipoprotein n=1 Tax=Saccharopolyspora dendranthemae TaxID=1181886 RepID=A0A561TX05_9PSEU|nr:hypothetical protein [Saccharopolyspora dendranthemae]TWF91647.1 hypothetical protein FHU35_1869 [Saccharopolyspora dendranthemae]
MGRPLATTALAVALLACEGAPSELAPPPAPARTSVERGIAPEEFQRFQRDPGYPHSVAEYDDLPRFAQCGSLCGREPTTGEQQRAHLCERGLIEAAEC